METSILKSKNTVTVDEIKLLASERLFGKAIIENVYRSVVVETMISVALREWEWCSGGYAPYDFRHPDGTRLEAKQAALRQTWVPKNPGKPSWDIKPRTGQWVDGSDWVPGVGRNADIYVFALHVREDDAADQRDPSQWSFFVVPTSALPDRTSLSLTNAKALSSEHSFDTLPDAVRRVHDLLVGRRD